VSIRQLAEQYKLTEDSIRTWIRELPRDGPPQRKQAVRVSEAHQRQAVWDIESGRKTLAEVALKFNVNPNTVYLWRTRFGLKAASVPEPPATTEPPDIDHPETRQHSTLPTEAERELRALRHALEQERLRNAALETLLDEAERTLRLPLRKNFGAKQSK
jgi:transposase-like protein